ncbi:MAG: type II toxin-antitoxin system RelE/ParE family toxin [Prosthecobacter sp.]|uniref:type II toxin-antitoxin system RelE/ParE family toxin n=1 Tax=Prosthecobacter sp. TaxID=1965333 RepID=UPI0039004539
MRLTYTAEARLEMGEAAGYYRSCRKELARAFKQRIEAAEDDIIQHPEAWRSLGDPYRRKLLKQFPYGLVYHQPESGWIEVVAVMHLHREPDYWRERVE